MPNHWESSARPLFVKTVLINGNRHAILSQKDPLLHSGNSSIKKQSRPNSSLSIGTIFSTSSSENQDCFSDNTIKYSKSENNCKDISSQLQGCLIKLRLSSSIHKTKDRSKDKTALNNALEEMQCDRKIENENLKQKRKKWNFYNTSKKQNCFEKERFADNQNASNNCCYVYNFENNKGKKNYCFVRITSKPNQLILKCSCDKNHGNFQNFCGSTDSPSSGKNNFVISATFHNLIMTYEKNEISYTSSNYLLSNADSESCDLYCDHHLTRSYHNSLTERVIHWLNLASKRKKRQESLEAINEEVSLDNIERVFAGKTFIDENNKSRYIEKTNSRVENKMLEKMEKGKFIQKEANEDVKLEVQVENNIETALSIQKFENDNQECVKQLNPFRKTTSSENLKIEKISETNAKQKNSEIDQSCLISIPTKTYSSSSLSMHLNNSNENHLYTSFSNLTESSMKVQESHLSSDFKDFSNYFLSTQNKRKTFKGKRGFLVRQSRCNKIKEEDIDVKIFKTPSVKSWEKKINQKNSYSIKSEISNVTMKCHCERNAENYKIRTRNRNLFQDFEKNQKAINNLNNTQSRPVSQTWLSPQQHNKDIKGVWSEKEMGRPQLHIFIPTLPSRDTSEESISECESFISEVY